MSITVCVSSKDIRLGRRRKSEHCPIAIAVRRSTGLRLADICPVMVWDGAVLVRDQVLQLPAKAVEFSRAFDRGLPVRPIRFRL